MMTRTLLTAAALGLTLSAVACSDDDDPTDPMGDMGTVQATLVDDPDPQPAPRTASQTTLARQLQAAFSGTFQGETRVEIYHPGDDRWVEVAGQSTTTLDLASNDQAVLGSSSQIDVGTYTRMRLTITGGEAVIGAGATLGGIVLVADVTLDLGGSSNVVIEKDVALTVAADATTTLVIDLNSEAWVTEENTDDGTVTEGEMESAADVEAMM